MHLPFVSKKRIVLMILACVSVTALLCFFWLYEKRPKNIFVEMSPNGEVLINGKKVPLDEVPNFAHGLRQKHKIEASCPSWVFYSGGESNLFGYFWHLAECFTCEGILLGGYVIDSTLYKAPYHDLYLLLLQKRLPEKTIVLTLFPTNGSLRIAGDLLAEERSIEQASYETLKKGKKWEYVPDKPEQSFAQINEALSKTLATETNIAVKIICHESTPYIYFKNVLTVCMRHDVKIIFPYFIPDQSRTTGP